MKKTRCWVLIISAFALGALLQWAIFTRPSQRQAETYRNQVIGLEDNNQTNIQRESAWYREIRTNAISYAAKVRNYKGSEGSKEFARLIGNYAYFAHEWTVNPFGHQQELKQAFNIDDGMFIPEKYCNRVYDLGTFEINDKCWTKSYVIIFSFKNAITGRNLIPIHFIADRGSVKLANFPSTN